MPYWFSLTQYIMFSFQQKIPSHAKGKRQSEETRIVSEPDSNMEEILELSDWEFEITTINMLGALMEKWTTHGHKWVV